ncbi:MAG: pirin family protein [Gordonia sp. (in: high G+C Gram-positive bacteria)]|uniref:pirin family protein n=1 Tax=Gordonia sp. (in: high G+C Gram-positive bacteria) TaxID=84139 RepID=UPI003BB680D7
MSLLLVRAADRAVTSTDWLVSQHGFSFGDHYDPQDTHHGVLLVHNDELVAPGQGFDTHPHAETEIVTWVLSGSLVHHDSNGNRGVIHPGLAQRMSAGTGLTHSERNDDAENSSEPAHYIQMWVLPDETGHNPSYEQRDISTELAAGGLLPLASGDRRHDSAIRIRNAGATLWVARLATGASATLPSGRFTHLFVTRGAVTTEGLTLATADTLRAADLGGTRVTAVSDAELLIWTMHSALSDLFT